MLLLLHQICLGVKLKMESHHICFLIFEITYCFNSNVNICILCKRCWSSR